MTSDKITVMVTAIGGGGYGGQILKALRLAPGNPYRIVGADTNPFCPQFALVDEAVALPRADAPDFLDAVLAVAKRYGVRVLFHGCEPELKVYSRERQRIEAAGIFLPISSAQVIDISLDKRKTAKFLVDNGFNALRDIELTDIAMVDQIDWFPVVVKPATASGGSKDCYIAQDREQLRLLVQYLTHFGQTQSLLVQEYCGTPQTEYTVGVLHDLDGDFINSIAVHRELKSQLNIRMAVPNRTNRRDLGETLVISSGVSQGYVDRFPEVCGPCEKIAAALGVRGAINIQCRLVGNEVRIFEINPRFSGTTSLRAMMGYNEPDILIRRHLLGETIVRRFSYGSGAIARTLIEYEVPKLPVASWSALG
jgi:carbamoyl-phosphate synthase large subunit